MQMKSYMQTQTCTNTYRVWDCKIFECVFELQLHY